MPVMVRRLSSRGHPGVPPFVAGVLPKGNDPYPCDMERVVLSGLAVFRWAAWTWMAVVLAVSSHQLRRPGLALALVGAALADTVLATVWLKRSPSTLLRAPVVSVELGLATALVVFDGWTYGAHHVFSTSQSLGSVWPLVTVLAVGVALGSRWGIAAGCLLGLGRLGAALANGARSFDGARRLSLVNTAVFYAVAGGVAGYLVGLLRRAESEISAARARDEVARTLHDGVLQTLAIVQSRSGDQALVRLARQQDRELRDYLFGDAAAVGDGSNLRAALRRAAARFEESFGIPVDVLVPEDLPELDEARTRALSRAVSEAMNNAGKHAGPNRVVVFADRADDGRVFCSVKDDGRGFDVGAGDGGVGIARSIMDRMREVGGRAEIRSRPGSGTEVRLWA